MSESVDHREVDRESVGVPLDAEEVNGGGF